MLVIPALSGQRPAEHWASLARQPSLIDTSVRVVGNSDSKIKMDII